MADDRKVAFNWYLNRQGPRGPQGVKGDTGFSPNITVETDTLNEYILRITNEGGYFLTSNLREHKEDRGGTYIRYDRENGTMYAGEADTATDAKAGMIKIATAEDVEAEDESTAVTPAILADYVAGIGGVLIDDTTASSSKVWSSEKTSQTIAGVSNQVATNTTDISNIKTALPNKQNKLIAGTNITIDGDIISATGSGSGDVTLAGNNYFTGNNIFTGTTKFDDDVNIHGANLEVEGVFNAKSATITDLQVTNTLTSSGEINAVSIKTAGIVNNQNGKHYLTQTSITAGTNVSIEETTDGVKISATGGGGGGSSLNAVQPLKLVDDTLTLQIDEQTIQVQNGKLVANLDELGNEVNTLVGDVASVQADLLNKQDKFTTSEPLSMFSGAIDATVDASITETADSYTGGGIDKVVDLDVSGLNIDANSNWSICLAGHSGAWSSYSANTTAIEIFAGSEQIFRIWFGSNDFRLGHLADVPSSVPKANVDFTYKISYAASGTQYTFSGTGLSSTNPLDVSTMATALQQTPYTTLANKGKITQVKFLVCPQIFDRIDKAVSSSYIESNGVKYPLTTVAGSNTLQLGIGDGLSVIDGKLTTTGGGGTPTTEKHGLEGDYCSRYGIVDCPNEILAEGTGQVTLKAGVVMQMTETDGLTTNASDMPHNITSTVDFDLFYTSGSLLEATQVIFSEQEPEDGAAGVLAWYNGMQWQFKSNDTGNIWRAAPAVRLAHIHITDGNITRIDYIGNRHLNKVIPVTTDRQQTITGSKTFNSPIYVNEIKGTLGSLVSQVLSDARISFGNVDREVQINGSIVVDKDNKKILTQSNVTAGDNISVTETADGVQITSTAVTPVRYPVEISDKSLMPSWYVVYNDGWCEQGGHLPQLAANNNDFPVTFLKPYKDLNYWLGTSKQIIPDLGSTTFAMAYTFYTRNRTSTGFTTDLDNNVACEWEAKGYVS
jgi:hypothetical protein